MALADASTHKEEGNAFFKSGDFLKAAAAYTKAIKADPENHVYYSNRSQAFLKLSKVTKALEDADKCISIAPEFVKGYHRKASALAAMNEEGKTAEAVQVLLDALEAGVDNNELVRLGIQIKGKEFVKLADARRKGKDPPPADETKENPDNGASKKPKPESAPPVPPPAKAPASGPSKHLWQLGAEEFAAVMIQDAFAEFLKTREVKPMCYMQPAIPTVPSLSEPPLTNISIEHAFASPETLCSCADFLKNHAAKERAQTAVILVRKSHIGYPRVWANKGKGAWKFSEKADGIFMQAESPTERIVYFTQITKDKQGSLGLGETIPLDVSEFGLFPRLF